MTLPVFLKKPHSLNKYLYRPFLLWTINQKKYYVFGTASLFEAESSLYLNAIPWGKLPTEWSDNASFIQYKNRKQLEHDKWLDDDVEKSIKTTGLIYQRSVKTIVQVGSKKTDIYKKQTTLPVDIIPLSHPYELTNNQILKVKILYKGQPLANTKIRTWHNLLGTVTDSSFMSNADGEISFPVETNGEWMVSCVHMIRITDNPKAQWQSYWGSVTWGYTGKAVKSDVSR